MPLYEYLCRECESDFELLIRSPDEQPVCPYCDSDKVMKLLSVPSAPAGEEPPAGPCGSGCGCFPNG